MLLLYITSMKFSAVGYQMRCCVRGAGDPTPEFLAVAFVYGNCRGKCRIHVAKKKKRKDTKGGNTACLPPPVVVDVVVLTVVYMAFP